VYRRAWSVHEGIDGQNVRTILKHSYKYEYADIVAIAFDRKLHCGTSLVQEADARSDGSAGAH
jgi:hypothetical protein